MTNATTPVAGKATLSSQPSASKPFDYLVFIGRFQPFHFGHLAILNKALAAAEHVVVVLGSAARPRTIKDPWTTQEREIMIRRNLSTEQKDRVTFIEVSDQLYNDQKWVASVQQSVEALIFANTPSQKNLDEVRVGLIGHVKDDSSFYLKMFPQWALVEERDSFNLHASDIRTAYFSGETDLKSVGAPEPVAQYLEEFKATEAFNTLQSEFTFIRDYKVGWQAAPYPPIFVTVDAVVVHSGHVLMVKRKAMPGKGLWALPGGFLNQKETIHNAVIRELREETRIKLPEPVLRGAIKDQAVFDHPERSLRGRTVTHAFYMEFPYGELPPVRGADDAEKAKWIPISKLFAMQAMMFEDHIDIISFFLGGH